MKKSVYQIITEKIVSQLELAIEQGTLAPWQKPWHTKMNHVSGRSYSGINLLLLPDDETEFITWGQLGKIREKDPSVKVKKGFQKHCVVKWIFPEDDEGKKKGYGYPIYYKVISLKDIQGLKHKYEPLEFKSCDMAEEILSAIDPQPEICHAGIKAAYFPVQDSINIPSKKNFNSSNEYYSTLFHELIHWTGHKERLNRGLENQFGTHLYSKEELIAEIGSAMLLSQCGIHESRVAGNQIAYLRSWLKVLKDDVSFIWDASGKAQKAVKYLLNASEAENAEVESKQQKTA